jgi:chromosome segregation protein
LDFKKLRISNFKSFVDPVEVNINEGLTGVVGPNGCGKSNLVEALRWVMGETSYKSMRTDAMDDVIFSGTENRPARNFAEVSLILDNKDRNAPNDYNKEDNIEIIRRIERESGSAYRVNGKDIRARDIQMFFADVSTGARSPSLVRQGQIDELISQKPEQRRKILEEAAGISGFHVRRHEAELRLNAANNNIDRLDDVLKELSSQIRSLRKQAREATRYKTLSEEIRNAQAVVLAVKLELINEELDDSNKKYNDAKKNHQDTINSLSRINTEEIQLVDELKPLKEKSASDAAKFQRLIIEMEGLDKELMRQEQRIIELDDFILSTSSQLERENEILIDLKNSLSAYSNTEEKIKKKSQIQIQIDENLSLLKANNEKINNFSSKYSQKENLEKITDNNKEIIDSILSQIKREKDYHDSLINLSKSENNLDSLSQKDNQIRELINKKTDELNQNESLINNIVDLYSQKNVLEKLLGSSLDVKNSLIDKLEVEPGFENALDALLGDELYYSVDNDQPIHWEYLGDFSEELSLPKNCEPLSSFIKGSNVVNRRLRQTGLVKKEDGQKLMSDLNFGQRLVSKEGDLWRWDGLVVSSSSSSSAVKRLQQRNKLDEINQSIKDFEIKHEDIEKLRKKSSDIQESITNSKIELDRVNTQIDAKEDNAEKIIKSKNELSILNNKLEEFNSESNDNLKQLAEIKSSIDSFEIEFGGIEKLRKIGEEYQETITTLKIDLDRISTEIESKGDIEKKIPQAIDLISSLEERIQNYKNEKNNYTSLPEEIDKKKNTLNSLIEKARLEKLASEDKLTDLENKINSMRSKQRDVVEQEAQHRESEARLETLLQNNREKKDEIISQIDRDLKLNNNQLLELVNFSEDNPRPDEITAEQNFERFKNEREILGGVNLRADDELEEVQDRFDETKSEREDLDAAISKLKKGISGLNQESRERMKLAFNEVNEKFQNVFKKLFGGGHAELNFVDSDDPLEAGLEMLAQPPGKKLKSMESLSGGEKALTAISLIFAVFLTNPSPICVLDEVDAPLDDANVERFCDLIEDMSKSVNTRFLIITHHALTMSRMDRLFGVTMQEKGISKLVSVDLKTAEKFRKIG